MRLRIVLSAVAVLALGALLAACGSSSNHPDHTSGTSAGTATDRAFLNDMTPHHKSAVAMAMVAQRRAGHPEVKQLADAIVRTQTQEIAQMTHLKGQLPVGDAKSTLGLSMGMMGMSADISRLEAAKPFDRAFIDDMVPHHQGAVTMAKAELAKGTNPIARALAQRIIGAQQKEIGQMNSWRQKWYGAPVPNQPKHGSHSMSGMKH